MGLPAAAAAACPRRRSAPFSPVLTHPLPEACCQDASAVDRAGPPPEPRGYLDLINNKKRSVRDMTRLFIFLNSFESIYCT